MLRTGPQFIDALKQAGCPVTGDIYPGHDHYSVHLKTADADDAWVRTVRQVMRDSR